MSIQITKLTNDFSTAPQISVDDVPEISKLGFKTIINNRPDHEGGDSQPTSAEIRVAAEKNGLAYLYIPVVPNNIHPAQIDAFNLAYTLAEKPVLGFCRTGNRAGSIFKQSQEKCSSSSPTTACINSPSTPKGNQFITRFWSWYKAKCPMMSMCRILYKKH